jgi:hypothetical protein
MDDLVKRLLATPLYEGSGEDSDLGEEAADHIAAQDELLKEMAEALRSIAKLNSPETAWDAVQAKSTARATLAKYDAMRGCATAAIQGDSLETYLRMFPRHRAALETETRSEQGEG